MTLTSWLLLVTFCSLLVALWMKLFEHKPFDAKAVLEFGILNGISIGLLNLGLGFNSVGFYQTTKLAIIPYTILLETLYFRKQFRTLSLSGIAGSIVYHWSQPNMKTSVKIIHARNLGSHKVALIVLDGCVGK